MLDWLNSPNYILEDNQYQFYVSGYVIYIFPEINSYLQTFETLIRCRIHFTD